jgi:CheY-like chemotaxis protein
MDNKKVIFILEDDAIILDALNDWLSEEYKVMTFSNGLEFRDALIGDVIPDLFILDIMVPIAKLTRENYEQIVNNATVQLETAMSTGLRIAREIRSGEINPLVRDKPLIFFTVRDKEINGGETSKLGAHYFLKGVDEMGKLIEFIRRILR